jgi:hypothetical protein
MPTLRDVMAVMIAAVVVSIVALVVGHIVRWGIAQGWLGGD